MGGGFAGRSRAPLRDAARQDYTRPHHGVVRRTRVLELAEIQSTRLACGATQGRDDRFGLDRACNGARARGARRTGAGGGPREVRRGDHRGRGGASAHRGRARGVPSGAREPLARIPPDPRHGPAHHGRAVRVARGDHGQEAAVLLRRGEPHGRGLQHRHERRVRPEPVRQGRRRLPQLPLRQGPVPRVRRGPGGGRTGPDPRVRIRRRARRGRGR